MSEGPVDHVRRVNLANGVAVADLTFDEAIQAILGLVRLGRSTDRVHVVTGVEPSMLTHAEADPAFAERLRGADLLLPVSMSVVWAARALGSPIRERVDIAEVVAALAAQPVPDRPSLCFVGDGINVKSAAELLAQRHPGLVIHALEDRPDRGGLLSSAVADQIARLAPDIVCVAGTPEDLRIDEAHRLANVPVLIACEDVFEELTGRHRRAPLWMQRVGLEWVARATQQPRRWGARYSRDASIVSRWLARELLRRRTTKGIDNEIADPSLEKVGWEPYPVQLPLADRARSGLRSDLELLLRSVEALIEDERDGFSAEEALQATHARKALFSEFDQPQPNDSAILAYIVQLEGLVLAYARAHDALDDGPREISAPLERAFDEVALLAQAAPDSDRSALASSAAENLEEAVAAALELADDSSSSPHQRTVAREIVGDALGWSLEVGAAGTTGLAIAQLVSFHPLIGALVGAALAILRRFFAPKPPDGDGGAK